jgi:hypothetical protein
LEPLGLRNVRRRVDTETLRDDTKQAQNTLEYLALEGPPWCSRRDSPQQVAVGCYLLMAIASLADWAMERKGRKKPRRAAHLLIIVSQGGDLG